MVLTDEETGNEVCIHPTTLIPTTHTVFNLDQTEDIDLSSPKHLGEKKQIILRLAKTLSTTAAVMQSTNAFMLGCLPHL